jgi:twitching motility protein PilT
VDITQLLAFSVKNKASDLHLSAGLPPMIRVHGDVRRINVDALDHKTVHAMVYDIMNDSQRKAYEEFLEVDFSFEIEGLARFRVNAFNQNRGAGRCSGPFQQDPDAGAAQRPKIFGDLALKPRGMVLVTGPTGSGKSTTLAAMVNHLNETEYGHVLTVEDPIEFVHESKKCLINQREVGPHDAVVRAALRSALREDPDAILVGEMRDLETIRLAMTAAETGHLVFGTLHTSSAAKTIDRIIDVFPAEEKEMIRAMLSESLQAVISQTLCKTKDGQGRVAAHEIMIGTSAIRNLIREAKVAQMYSTIQTGNSVGMQTLDQNLTDLVRRNIISRPKRAARPRSPRTSRADLPAVRSQQLSSKRGKVHERHTRIAAAKLPPEERKEAGESVFFSTAFAATASAPTRPSPGRRARSRWVPSA